MAYRHSKCWRQPKGPLMMFNLHTYIYIYVIFPKIGLKIILTLWDLFEITQFLWWFHFKCWFVKFPVFILHDLFGEVSLELGKNPCYWSRVGLKEFRFTLKLLFYNFFHGRKCWAKISKIKVKLYYFPFIATLLVVALFNLLVFFWFTLHIYSLDSSKK